MKRQRSVSPQQRAPKRQRPGTTLANASNAVSKYLNARSLAQMSAVSKGVRHAARAELHSRPVKPLLDFFGPRVKAMQQFMRQARDEAWPVNKFRKMARKHRALFTTNLRRDDDMYDYELIVMHKPSRMQIHISGTIRDDGILYDLTSMYMSIPSVNIWWTDTDSFRPEPMAADVGFHVRKSANPNPWMHVNSHIMLRYALLGERHWCDRPFTNAEAIRAIQTLTPSQSVAFPEMLEVIRVLFGNAVATGVERNALRTMKENQEHACKTIRARRVNTVVEKSCPKAGTLLRQRSLTGRTERVTPREIDQLNRGLRRAIARITTK